MIILTTSILLSLILESINEIIILKWAKNNKKFIYKYLAKNAKNITLEHFLFKQFFPAYLGILCAMFFMLPYMHYTSMYIISSILGLSMRIYYRKIFSDFYNILRTTLESSII